MFILNKLSPALNNNKYGGSSQSTLSCQSVAANAVLDNAFGRDGKSRGGSRGTSNNCVGEKKKQLFSEKD